MSEGLNEIENLFRINQGEWQWYWSDEGVAGFIYVQLQVQRQKSDLRITPFWFLI